MSLLIVAFLFLFKHLNHGHLQFQHEQMEMDLPVWWDSLPHSPREQRELSLVAAVLGRAVRVVADVQLGNRQAERAGIGTGFPLASEIWYGKTGAQSFFVGDTPKKIDPKKWYGFLRCLFISTYSLSWGILEVILFEQKLQKARLLWKCQKRHGDVSKSTTHKRQLSLLTGSLIRCPRAEF